MMLPLLPVAKLALNGGIVFGVDAIVKGIVVKNVVAGPLLSRAAVKIASYAASTVIASVLIEKTNKYIDEQVADILKAKSDFNVAALDVKPELV